MEGAYTGGDARPPLRQLRPLSIGQLLDAAMKLYSRNAASMWKIVLAVVVPLVVIRELVIGISLPHGAFVRSGVLHTPTGQLSTPALSETVEIVLGVLGPLLVNGALALFLVDAYVGQPVDWIRSLRVAGDRFGDLVWLAILNGVLVFIGFILAVIPGIWLAVSWSVAIPALMFEHVGGVEALRRSFRLVHGRWWPTFGAIAVAVITLLIVLLVVDLIFQGIDSGLGVRSAGLWLVINAISTLIADLITYPLIAAIIAVIYVDLRVRKQPLDLGLLAAGPAGRDEPAGHGTA